MIEQLQLILEQKSLPIGLRNELGRNNSYLLYIMSIILEENYRVTKKIR